MSIQHFQYVPHHEVAKRYLEGWNVANDMGDCHHGRHAVLMSRPAPVEELSDANLAAGIEEIRSELRFTERCIWFCLGAFSLPAALAVLAAVYAVFA